MMKTKLLIISIISLLAFSGCEDFLDQQPVSQISEDAFYKTQADIETAIVGAYDALQSVYLREFALTEMRSDNTGTRLHEGEWQELEYLNVGVNNNAVLNYWTASYYAIHLANTVLAHTDVIENAAVKTQIEAEAKFIRALMHFNLVRLYGNILWVDHVVSYLDAPDFKQSPSATVYTNIIADLTDAVAGLPVKGSIEHGRATKGAAQALLANVYLTTKSYAQAASLLNDVITGGNYSLVTPYRNIFYTERGAEILFAVEYLDNSTGNSQDFSREFTSDGTASGINYPTANLLNSWGITPTGVYKTDSAAFKQGGNDSIRVNTSLTFDAKKNRSVGKFVLPTGVTALLGGNDWIILRYADVLLMYAEAVLAGGTSTSDAGAVNAYTRVLARAGKSITGITSFTAAELLAERRREFAFENKRWYDLDRFGVLKSTLTAFAAGEGTGFTFEDSDLLLPIPNAEINASNVLVQNPGY